MPLDRTLIDLDRVPTFEELKAFFKKHDWSAAQLSDPKSRDPEKAAEIKEIKRIMNAAFEKKAREKGLAVPSKYLENRMRVNGVDGNYFDNQGNSLLELRDSTEDLVSDAVQEIGSKHEDILESIFSQFDLNDPDIDKKADDFLNNAVGTMLDVMDYEELAKIVQEMSAFEDFNPSIHPNYRAEDHNRGWYHLDTKHPTLPDPDAEELAKGQYPKTEETAISNIAVEEFWKSLDEKDRVILQMTMDGYTQEEVARAVGMANNSGISKRIAKIREAFIKKTGIKIE